MLVWQRPGPCACAPLLGLAADALVTGVAGVAVVAVADEAGVLGPELPHPAVTSAVAAARTVTAPLAWIFIAPPSVHLLHSKTAEGRLWWHCVYNGIAAVITGGHRLRSPKRTAALHPGQSRREWPTRLMWARWSR